MRKNFADICQAKIGAANPTTARRSSVTEIVPTILRTIRDWRDQTIINGAARPLENIDITLNTLERASNAVQHAGGGSVPMFSFDYVPENEHVEFGKDLLESDLFELPFGSVVLRYSAPHDYDDRRSDSYAFLDQIPIDDLLRRWVEMGLSKAREDGLVTLRRAYGRVGKRIITYVGAGTHPDLPHVAVCDGIGLLMSGEGIKSKNGGMNIHAPDFSLMIERSFQARTSLDMSGALRRDTEYGIHAAVGLIASLLSRDTIITPTADPTKLNKSRLKHKKPPLEAQYLIRLAPEARRALSSARLDRASGRSVSTHMRRGHIRRWPSRDAEGVESIRLIPIPPCVVNADGGEPLIKDYAAVSR